MKVYMSFWSSCVRAKNQNLDIWKLSLALAKKNYGEVFLITDNIGADIFKNLPFTHIFNVLNDVPKFKDLWSLGKIYAYYYASKLGHFLHLDNDVFLWEKLPVNLTESRVFVQSGDFQIFKDGKVCFSYDIKTISDILNVDLPPDWKIVFDNKEDLLTYNMGIFGGKDTDFIKSYCEYVFEMINNIKYRDLWEKPVNTNLSGKTSTHIIRSCMIEQANLGIFCKKNNFLPSTFFEEFWDKHSVSYKKYTHLMGAKNQSEVLRQIRDRVSEEPYNLLPNNCSLKDWSKNPPDYSLNYKDWRN